MRAATATAATIHVDWGEESLHSVTKCGKNFLFRFHKRDANGWRLIQAENIRRKNHRLRLRQFGKLLLPPRHHPGDADHGLPTNDMLPRCSGAIRKLTPDRFFVRLPYAATGRTPVLFHEPSLVHNSEPFPLKKAGNNCPLYSKEKLCSAPKNGSAPNKSVASLTRTPALGRRHECGYTCLCPPSRLPASPARCRK